MSLYQKPIFYWRVYRKDDRCNPPSSPPKKITHGGPHIMLINSSTLSNYVFGYTSVEKAWNNKVFYSICGIFFSPLQKVILDSDHFSFVGFEGRKSFWLLMFSLVQLRAFPSSNRKSFINFFSPNIKSRISPNQTILEQHVYNKS